MLDALGADYDDDDHGDEDEEDPEDAGEGDGVVPVWILKGIFTETSI